VVGVTFGALRLVKVLAAVTKKNTRVEEVEEVEETIANALVLLRARDV
jgi:hypothetical protein